MARSVRVALPSVGSRGRLTTSCSSGWPHRPSARERELRSEMEVKQLLTSRQFKPATGVQKRAVRGYVSVKGDKAGDKAAAAEHAAVERDYIYNLQQQVYLLELELQTLRAQGPPAPASEDVVPGLNSQIAVLKEGKVRAEFGEVAAREAKDKAVEELRQIRVQFSTQRQELTAEVVALQRELEQCYLKVRGGRPSSSCRRRRRRRGRQKKK